MTDLLLGELQDALDRIAKPLAGKIAPTSTSPLEIGEFLQACLQEDIRTAIVRQYTAADLRILAGAYNIAGRSKMAKNDLWGALVGQSDFARAVYDRFIWLRWPERTTNDDETLKTFDEEHSYQSEAPSVQTCRKTVTRKARRKAGRKKRKQRRLNELQREFSRRELRNEAHRRAKLANEDKLNKTG